MGILTNVGLLSSGKPSEKTRERFISDVKNLIQNGNNNKFWIVPIPPNFNGSLLIPELENKNIYSTYHNIFIDSLLGSILKTLDINGSTSLFPICDPTAVISLLGLPLPNKSFEDILKFFIAPNPISLLEFLEVKPDDIPDLLKNLSNFKPPGLPSPPPIPQLPNLNDFNPPGSNLNISFPIGGPGINIMELISTSFSLIPKLFGQIIANSPELITKIPGGPQKIIEFFSNIIIKEFLGSLGNIDISSFNIFLASFVVLIKYIIISMILVILGSLIGDGLFVKSMSEILLI